MKNSAVNEEAVTNTPANVRRALIGVSASAEREARKEYTEALNALHQCDPLSIGYEDCQSRLTRAAKKLIDAREANRLALAGINPQPQED